MTVNCQQVAQEVGSGVAAALRAVDCTAGNLTAQAFGRLFAPGGSMATVLTILLTIYIAIFGLQLLTGRSSIGVRALTPRMITVGLVLTFATSWVAYQSVVWNLAIGAPDWLAGVLTGTTESATTTFAQKIDVVFLAIQQASAGAEDISAFSPEGMMWLGAMLFMLGTVGLLVTARIALAVLVALGPVFVVMALFEGTRGLFAGWLKGVTMLALAPLFAVIGGSVMLELAVPVLSTLVATPGQVDAQAAMGFFMIGAVHVALMVLVLRTAATMVGGWTVFGLARSESDRQDAPTVIHTSTPAAAAGQPATEQARATSQVLAQARRIDIAAQPVAMPANDAGGSTQTAQARTTRVFNAASGAAPAQPGIPPISRAHGVGSRFRSANTSPLESKK
ncbi:type IV secretion system protein [Qipengyuania sp. DY56-A-20]|jgi:type IV secretion system protein VirB6|uniref:Type IV secretion system protein n=1 Tax=Qipengyuania benthica TaxID=3067651 RepID=A0ABT9H9S2_9SPHN|nr:type IV secretion system protein [Qipengyuania sp. DY56-A-20]MDP4540080.1 type IV secretion system protein [Qipengyuania sp. DY56-A-20]